MTRERKLGIGLALAGWVLSTAIQAGSFVYSFGRLSQKVDDLAETVKGLVQQQIAKQR